MALRSLCGAIAVCLLALTLLARPSVLPAQAQLGGASPATPLDLLRHPEEISQLRPLVTSMQVSSHDKAGFNYDNGHLPDDGLESYLYRDGANYVLLDETGPGTITRMWFYVPSDGAYRDYHLLVFFEGEPSPRVDLSLGELFSGSHTPFLSPLVGNADQSSGGSYSYVPMSFSQSVRVELTGPPSYYDIGYEENDPSLPAETFDPDMDVSDVVARWQTAGQDPKNVSDPEYSETGQVEMSTPIPPGGSEAILDLAGPAIITSIKLSVAGYDDPSDPVARDFFSDVRIRATWDGASQPNVDVPLAGFFGSMVGKAPMTGLYFGFDPPSNTFYNYFPMPFANHGLIELVNGTAGPISGISYEIRYTLPAAIPGLGSNVGYFNSRFDEEAPVTPGRDFNLATIAGSGHIVATSLLAKCYPPAEDEIPRACLEGDERIYVDGSDSPDLYGTGTEDFFNGGFYFMNGTFSRPTHGNEYSRVVENEPGTLDGFSEDAAWRLFAVDPLEFRSGISMGIEHGNPAWVTGPPHKSTWPGDYSSVVSWYGIPTPAMRLVDQVAVSDAASEAAHRYVSIGLHTGPRTFFYEGENDEVPVTDAGETSTAPVQFRIAVDGSQDAVLRRRLDQSYRNQRATVAVDGVAIGDWYDAGRNTMLRWRDSEIFIPQSVISGKSAVTVTITPAPGSVWTSYDYAVYAIGPPVHIWVVNQHVADAMNDAHVDFTTASGRAAALSSLDAFQLAGTSQVGIDAATIAAAGDPLIIVQTLEPSVEVTLDGGALDCVPACDGATPTPSDPADGVVVYRVIDAGPHLPGDTVTAVATAGQLGLGSVSMAVVGPPQNVQLTMVAGKAELGDQAPGCAMDNDVTDPGRAGALLTYVDGSGTPLAGYTTTWDLTPASPAVLASHATTSMSAGNGMLGSYNVICGASPGVTTLEATPDSNVTTGEGAQDQAVVVTADSSGGIPAWYVAAHACIQSGDPGSADPDDDGLTNVAEYQSGTDPCNPDTDADACDDAREGALGLDPRNPWDFFSVPVPALLAATDPLVVFKVGTLGAGDAQAVFAYFKASARAGTTVYDQDLNANAIMDGVEYDRSVEGPGVSGPPDGVVGASDAQLAFAQFKNGYHC